MSERRYPTLHLGSLTSEYEIEHVYEDYYRVGWRRSGELRVRVRNKDTEECQLMKIDLDEIAPILNKVIDNIHLFKRPLQHHPRIKFMEEI